MCRDLLTPYLFQSINHHQEPIRPLMLKAPDAPLLHHPSGSWRQQLPALLVVVLLAAASVIKQLHSSCPIMFSQPVQLQVDSVDEARITPTHPNPLSSS